MKKIRKFKINLRMREIMRLLKTTARISEITPQLEEAISREARRVIPVFAPSAIYETVLKEKLQNELIVSAPEKWVAATVFLVTIGSDIEHEIKEAQGKDENILSQILHAAALEALEQSGSFVYRLINEEAKEDECAITRQQLVNSASILEKILEILPLEKIGVQVLDKETFQPMYTSAGIVYWVPLKKQGRGSPAKQEALNSK